MEPGIPGNYSGADGEGWVCDACGARINIAADGCVQWVRLDREEGRVIFELHLVHADNSRPPGDELKCTVDGANTIATYPLVGLLGATGLQRLFEFTANPNWPLEEVLEMMRRLHMEGYEARRFHQVSFDDLG